jgi:PAS domain S-box-containing protein
VRTAQAAFIEADDKRHAFESLLDALLTVTGSEYGFVGEVMHDLHGQPYLKTHAITNIAWDEATRRLYAQQQSGGMEFHNLQTLFGHVLTTAEPLISNAPGGDVRAGGLPNGHPAMSAFLGVPIVSGGQLVGMVGLANQPGGYTEADIEFLQPLLGTVRQLVMAWRGHAERKRTRSQLEATSALLAEKSAALQVTFDSISQGLAMVDAEGRYAFYNHRMLELLNLPPALMAGRPTHEEVVRFQMERGDFGDNLSLLDPSLHRYVGMEPQVISPDAYVRKTADGRVLEILTRKLPDGGMVRTYADVTSYLETQEALRDERQRLAWVLEATRPGIWETNVATGEMVINDRWAEMLGYTVDELMPTTFQTWRRLVHPQDLERAERMLRRHWDGELDYYECDVRMRHRAGHWVWINDRGRVHQRDAQGRVLFMSGTHLDISERVAAQEQVRALNATLERRVVERTAELERSMKDMEAISYSIAHDLRAPLRSVNGFAALIAEDEGEGLSPGGREMFERIARSSRNMGQMITDMLELLRVVRVELEAVPVNMHALAQTAVEALGTSAEQARIDVQPLPQALGDATLLRQVLINLMDNALKYSRGQAQPMLVLGFDTEKRAYFLRDNGMGFDMARAGKLFGLFQRLHVGSDVPGTGVGLAIVARIVERHSGRIWAESAPGAGATFWWTLPQS